MANWEDLRIMDVIEKIDKEEISLPVIQRELVWNEEQISLLFDTLMRGDSFGAIMTLKDWRGREPLFEFRSFIKDYIKGTFIFSTKVNKLSNDISYVIDGQQRLSAFYIGLTGSYEGKNLYFDLLSEWDKEDFYFDFSNNSEKLKKYVDKNEGDEKRRTFWYKVKDLFKELKNVGGQYKFVVSKILETYNNFNFSDAERELIRENIDNFNTQILNAKNLGVCEVMINFDKDIYWNRRKAVELFRRLNQGGTKLSALDLMASILKSFSAENEKFLYEEIKEFNDIGFGQDEIIKYIFILQDNHNKGLIDIEKTDSDFIKDHKLRILNSLKGVKQFLIASKLYDFYSERNSSIIPLYFIGYHLFHSSKNDNDLKNYFQNVEQNTDYKLIYKWMFMSLLQKVFRRRGAGWIAYKTGIRKILDVIRNYKEKNFPVDEIFKTYINHPLTFNKNLRGERLDSYDFDFLMYLIYGKKFRKEDVDHIHPFSILNQKGIEHNLINTFANYQLLDYGLNRGDKNNKELKDWIAGLENKEDYLKRHLIPDNNELWNSDNYLAFLEERKRKVINFLNDKINI